MVGWKEGREGAGNEPFEAQALFKNKTKCSSPGCWNPGGEKKRGRPICKPRPGALIFGSWLLYGVTTRIALSPVPSDAGRVISPFACSGCLLLRKKPSFSPTPWFVSEEGRPLSAGVLKGLTLGTFLGAFQHTRGVEFLILWAPFLTIRKARPPPRDSLVMYGVDVDFFLKWLPSLRVL